MAHVYVIDIKDQLDKFRSYHEGYAHTEVQGYLHESYIAMLVEQMIAHFDVERTAVQMFVGHYTQLITENISPNFKYHPLKFLRQMSTQEYQYYIYCLYGFAEEMFKLFQAHGLFGMNGKLLASYEKLDAGNLYLMVRPEAPNVFHL